MLRLVDDTLTVDGRAVRGENRRADEVRAALGNQRTLATLGVGWVLVAHGTPGQVDTGAVTGLSPAYAGRWLTLYRLPGPILPSPRGGQH